MMLTDHRNLPDVVRQRLANANIDLDTRHRGFDIDYNGKTLELRATRRVEVRKAADGSPVVTGYASVYDAPYDVFGGPEANGWTEIISRGASDKSIREQDDVYLFFDHDGLPLAATRAGTLTLESDRIGLYSEARVDPADPLSMAIVRRLERRELDAMSFAFKVIRQRWEDEEGREMDPMRAPVRRIQEVRLFDVSVVSFPANPATYVQVRAGVDGSLSIAEARAEWDTLRRPAA
jgi:HK97 family phage prohead protease